MARIRTVKPEFWSDPVTGRMSDPAKLLALALLNMADDEGFFYADPAIVRSFCRPFDEDSTIIRRSIEELSIKGFVEQVEHPKQGPIGWIVNFTKHQKIDRPKPSELKEYFHSSINRRIVVDESPLEGKGKEGNGKDLKPFVADDEIVDRPKAEQKKENNIVFDFETESFFGITSEQVGKWSEAFPAIDVQIQIKQAAAWLVANPRNRKSNYRRFLTAWMSRSQDKAPAAGGGPLLPGPAGGKQPFPTKGQARDDRTIQAAIEFATEPGGHA